MTHNNNRSLELVREGALGPAGVPEQNDSDDQRLAADLEAKARIALRAREAMPRDGANPLPQHDFGLMCRSSRNVVDKQEAADNSRAINTLQELSMPHEAFVAYFRELNRERVKRGHPALMIGEAPEVDGLDERVLEREALREKAEAVAVLADPTASARKKLSEVRESIDAGTRFAACLQARCA